MFENFSVLRLPLLVVLLTQILLHGALQLSFSGCSISCIFQLRGLAPQTGRTFSNILKARSYRSAMSTDATNRRIMSIAGHVSRAMLSRYSHVRMEAKRRALDEIAARQRAADEKRK